MSVLRSLRTAFLACFAARSFAARSFAARSFAAHSFAARSFAARSFAAHSFAARSFAARSFAARSFATRSFTARSFAACIILLATACSGAAVTPAANELDAITEVVVPPSPPLVTPVAPSPSPEPPPPAPTIAPGPSPAPTRTDPPTPTMPPASTAAGCTVDLCSYAAPLFLRRPILPPGNDAFDVTYRFGTTQGKARDPHHGVEFLNAFGTPVVAAADGIVITAGTDIDPTSPHGAWPITFFGPYMNFYGNLVVIEHQPPADLLAAFPDLPSPVYTLYGHLSEIAVQVGQAVTGGQEIGKVGQAGIATGPHLHFEVRLGENSYAASRNPELWLVPPEGPNPQPLGALAGRFVDSYGNNLEIESIVIQHLPDGPEGSPGFEVTLMSYEEKKLIGLPPFEESFGVANLPAGWYRVSFPMNGLRQELVQIFPGALTVITFH